MYKELDEILSEDCSEDSWYDDGFIYAQDLLNKFTEENWKTLFKQFNNKSDKWKIKLAYCINDDLGMTGLELLLNMLNENDAVIETVIDSLRSFNSEEYKKIILSNNHVISNAKKLIDTSYLPVKRVAEEFLKTFK
jgi:hypothetical protein